MVTHRQFAFFSAAAFKHRARILASDRCGCFCCGAIFTPNAIREWTDDAPGQPGLALTALCPECGIDAVIPDDFPGYPLSLELLRAVHIQGFDLCVAVTDPDGTHRKLRPPKLFDRCPHGFPGA